MNTAHWMEHKYMEGLDNRTEPFVDISLTSQIGRLYTVEGPEILARLEAIETMLSATRLWDEVYAGYVLYSYEHHMYRGPGESYWVALRQYALRFTKSSALTLILKDGLANGEHWRIEPA